VRATAIAAQAWETRQKLGAGIEDSVRSRFEKYVQEFEMRLDAKRLIHDSRVDPNSAGKQSGERTH